MRALCLGVALALMAATSAAQAGYSAIAASVVGVGTAKQYSTMEAARNAAVAECRRLGGSCSATTAENDTWYFAAGVCNGVAYTAASPQGMDRAEDLVFAKGRADGRPSCRITHSF